jgi:RNA polymerase sigma-54 factor
MIEGEVPGHPLSDQEIADRLGDEGVAIARRTVAKYRDELQLLPARLRRR